MEGSVAKRSAGPSRRRGGGLVAGRRSRDERGSALVEFALVAPLLLMLIFGMIAFGMVLYNQLALTNATNLGAQALASSRATLTTGANQGDPCGAVETAVYNAAPTLSQSKLSFTIVINGTTEVAGATGSSVTCTSAYSSLATGQSSTVTITYPSTLSFIGVHGGAITLSASLTEAMQ